MSWNDIKSALDDGNAQNANAANAGDGPKHIAWLTFMDVLGGGLRTVLETHSGGGIYRVPSNRFCVALPDQSILGRHQAAAALPAAESRIAYYSASGDQALSHMPSRCRYIAFDTCVATADRLAALARCRARGSDFDGRPRSYAGNGDPANAFRHIILGSNQPVLVMVDPFMLDDLQRASREVRAADNARAVLFGVTGIHMDRGRRESEAGWAQITGGFGALNRMTWKWVGAAGPNEQPQNAFFLLIVTPDKAESDELLKRLESEHQLLEEHRGDKYGYKSDGPQRA